MKKEKKRVSTLESQIAGIKQEINNIGDLRRGSLSAQYNICGTPGMQVQGNSANKARSILPVELYEEWQEQYEVCKP